MAKHEIACSINPALRQHGLRGHEADRAAGAASPSWAAVRPGMEAARIATERGHLVTLYERAGELGGAMKYVCMVPGKEKMRWYLDWIRDQLLDLHVDIRLNHAPTVDELRGFDVVLNATGAASYVPEVAGDTSKVVPFEETMACPKVACECHPGGRKMRKLGGERAPALGRPLRGHRHRGLARRHRQARSRSSPRTASSPRRPRSSTCTCCASGSPRATRRSSTRGRTSIRSRSSRARPSPRSARAARSSSRTGTSTGSRCRSTTSSPATPDPRPRCSRSCEAAGVHVLNVGDSVRPRNLYHAVKEGAAVRPRRRRAPAVQPQRRDRPRPADRRPRRSSPARKGPSYTAARMLELAGMREG